VSSVIDRIKAAVVDRLEQVDLNRNGVPDYRDPALVEAAFNFLVHLVRRHLPDNSPVRIGLEAAAQVQAHLAGTAELEGAKS
jgi:hypothetical protein